MEWFWMRMDGLTNSIGECLPHRGTRLKGTQDGDGLDRRFGKCGRDVGGDARKTDDFDSKALAGFYGSLQIGPAEVLKAEGQGAARNGLLEHVGVLGQLIAHGRSNEVRPVRVEAFLNQEIHLAEVDDTHVDGHLLGLTGSWLPRLRHRHSVLWFLLGFHSDSN
jgi:hypothetical protein